MPRPSDSAETNKPRRRRRRRFSKRKKRLRPENHAGKGSSFFTNGVGASLGAISWLWRMTTSTLSWPNSQIDERRGGVQLANAGIGTSSSAANIGMGTVLPGVVVVCGTVAGILMFRISRKRRGVDQKRPKQPAAAETTATAGKEGVRHDGGVRESEQKFSGDRHVYHTSDRGDERSKTASSPSNGGSSSRLGWSPRHRKMKTTAVTEGSGERRLSLYDVLTGEAPLPPPRGEKPDAGTAAASIMSGGRFHRNRCSGGGGGDESDTVPLGGGARRASIFDRIADVVFNEEQKDQNPVDAVAVRSELEDNFQVSFREGAMGMTLSMDPDTRDAVVGKIAEQGQAFRAGVQKDDFVIGVGEHTVSSYGTVLAFMNIMGRPIELRFRKADPSGRKGSSGSGGEPISASRANAVGGGGGGSAAVPEGFMSKPGRMPMRGSSLDRARGDSSSRKFKGVGTKSGGGKAPSSPISPRSSSRVSGLGALGREVASSDSGFSQKMERGVVVTKYGKKGAAAQRVLYLDGASMSVAWRDLDARSPGHRRSTSFTNIIKGKREALALAHLIEVVAGDDPDPARPSEKGSSMLREHCDESLLERSFALQFKERSLEMTCDSHAEMRQLVTGFRDLQDQYGQ